MKHIFGTLLNLVKLPYCSIRKTIWKNKFGKYGIQSIVNEDSTLVPQNMYIDDYVVIQDKTNFISLKGKLIVKKYSVISSGCIIVPSAHKLKVGVPFYLTTTKHIGDANQDIIIDEDCWIGAGCILLPGVHIGRGAVVGAGSVITKDVLPYTIVAGVPARVIGLKFSLDDIIKHEEIIYNEDERLPYDLIAGIVNKYGNMIIVGDNQLNNEEKNIVEVFFKKNITNKSYESLES